MNPDKYIWQKFHIHKNDNLPFFSWLPTANRNNIAELFADLGYTRGAEIGVRTGEFSQVMLEANKNLTLLCIDTWAPYGRTSQQRQDRYLRYCNQRLAPYKHEIMKMSSMEALNHVPDNSLDFVYIDGRHEFDFVMQDLIGWSPKVRSGGIVSGHDYFQLYQCGVIQAVNAYTYAHNINQWYITREAPPSFFWVKL